MCRLRRILAFGHRFLIPEVLELLQRSHVDVESQMAEEGGGDAPENMICTFLIFFHLLLDDLFGLVSVDDLVEAGLDVAASELLEHYSSLEQEASVGNNGIEPLHFSCPEEEPWVFALAVNCNEVEVIVEAGKVGAHIILRQV